MYKVKEYDTALSDFWNKIENNFGNLGKQSQMIINDYDKNRRHYPIVKPKSEQPTIKLSSLGIFDGDWESPDESLDDQNDWGGISEAIKPLPVKPVATITAHQVSEILAERENIRSNIQTDYANYIIHKPKEKMRWVLKGHIAIGGHPILNSFEDNLDFLKSEGIKAIVSTCEKELAENYILDFDYYFAPTLYGYTADLIGICEFMEEMEQNKSPLFIHSFDGCSRALTAYAAYIIYRHWLSVAETIKHIQQAIPGSKINDYQKYELIKFGKRL